MIDELLIAPLREFAFMRHGLAVVAIVGVTTSVLSCLLVVRRQALMGDAVAHSVLLGVVLGWLVAREAGIFWGAMAAGILTGVTITYVERNSRLRFDAAMGIFFTFAFALALAIISVVQPKGIDLFHVLLGNVLAVGPADVWAAATCGAIVLGLLLVFFSAFHSWSFDPVGAHAAGMRTAWIQYSFMAMLSATIVVSIQAVGLVLVIAMLVTPGATAYLLSERLAPMMGVAALIGLLAGVSGLYGSFYVNVASGPAIVIVASTCFLLAFVLAPRRGLLACGLSRRRLAHAQHDEDILRALVVAEAEQGRLMDVREIAAMLQLGMRSVAASLRRLRRTNALELAGGAPRPTEAGRQRGLQLVRRNRVLETYLHNINGVSLDQLRAEADRMEHGISASSVSEMSAELDNPRRDPHGDVIPGQDERLTPNRSQPLSSIDPGHTVRVISVDDSSEDACRFVQRNRLLPDGALSVLGRNAAGVQVRHAGQTLLVPSDLAAFLRVSPFRLVMQQW